MYNLDWLRPSRLDQILCFCHRPSYGRHDLEQMQLPGLLRLWTHVSNFLCLTGVQHTAEQRHLAAQAEIACIATSELFQSWQLP